MPMPVGEPRRADTTTTRNSDEMDEVLSDRKEPRGREE